MDSAKSSEKNGSDSEKNPLEEMPEIVSEPSIAANKAEPEPAMHQQQYKNIKLAIFLGLVMILCYQIHNHGYEMSNEEINRLNQEVTEAKKLIENYKMNINAPTEKLNQLDKDIKNCLERIQTCDLALEDSNDEITHLKKALHIWRKGTCRIPSHERVFCGWTGIDLESCEERGCCFDDITPNPEIRCFNRRKPQEEACQGSRSNRIDCGLPGITEQQCLNRGCCYDDSTKSAKWCYNKRNIEETCNIANQEKISCGNQSSEKKCKLDGCCYDFSDDRGPFCFNRRVHQERACIIPKEQRVSCIENMNITSKKQCMKNKCCFDSSTREAKFCYKKRNVADGCSVDPQNRISCGKHKHDRGECLRNGCCYDAGIQNAPICYNKPALDEYCKISGPNRVDCGWSGITDEQCVRRGCCYDNSYNGAPPCFNRRVSMIDACMVDIESRIDCNFQNLSPKQCRSVGCCYDGSTKTSITCYNPRIVSSQCKVDPKKRVDCGYGGITREACEEKGCCYDSGYRDVPWCFNKPNSDDFCKISGDIRVECGWQGIDRKRCEAKRCCFDRSELNAPECFKRTKTKNDICMIEEHYKTKCGPHGITEDECRNEGCCFDDSRINTEWCYMKREKEGCYAKSCSGVTTTKSSGVYNICNIPSKKMWVYCDMKTDGGGWLVILRRGDATVSFNRRWNEYVNGFGHLRGNLWFGLENIHRLTFTQKYILRVDLINWYGEKKYAKYRVFKVGSASENYKLFVDGYSGTAGDALQDHSQMPFAAEDKSPNSQAQICASQTKSGWWFNKCYSCLLTGPFSEQETTTQNHVGLEWNTWVDANKQVYNLRFVEMKIKLE